MISLILSKILNVKKTFEIMQNAKLNEDQCYSSRSSVRQSSRDKMIEREYKKMLLKLNSKINEQNEEFFSPEYLYDQKLKLNDEIAQLKNEIRPLNKELTRLEILAEEKGIVLKPEKDSLEAAMIEEIFEEKKESCELENDLANLKRETSNISIIKLKYEIQEYSKEIRSMYSFINRANANANDKREKLNRIKESELAKRIMQKNEKIKEMEHDLELANGTNAILRDRMYLFIKNSSNDPKKQNVEDLKKKYEVVKTIKLRKQRDAKKQRNVYDNEIEGLRRKIDEKSSKNKRNDTLIKKKQGRNDIRVERIPEDQKKNRNLPPLADNRRVKKE